MSNVLKPYEVRKDVPGFEGFVAAGKVRSSNTIRESEGKASAFVRIAAGEKIFSRLGLQYSPGNFIVELEADVRPTESEVRYDKSGFIELRLEDYPIGNNDKAIAALKAMAAKVQKVASEPQLRVTPETEKREPVLA